MNLAKAVRNLGRTPMYAFFAGFFAALLGIATAIILFPENTGIVSVFFVSLALFPFWGRILRLGMVLEGTERTVVKGENIHITELKVRNIKSKLNILNLIRTHHNVFQAYIFSFLGIFLVYLLLEMLVPVEMAVSLFGEQTSIFGASASAGFGSFMGILVNNFGVLLICFLIALVYRSGVFIVAWNASVWGVIFGLTVRNSALMLGHEPLVLFFISIVIIIPHLIAEALAYIFAAVAGSVVYETISQRFGGKIRDRMFRIYISDALMILLIGIGILVAAAAVETFFAIPWINVIYQR